MAFIKLQTDAFINPKVRRLTDGAFRMWVYLLGQAWVESPGKPAGMISVKGIIADDEGHARTRASCTFGSACGADDGDVYQDTNGQHRGMLDELENVGLVHVTTVGVGTTVGTDGTATWDIWDMSLSMHDWEHHNPRKPPSHQPEGEAERKRKYRAQLQNNGATSPKSSPKRPKAVVPSVPTLDKDQDKDLDQDPDGQGPSGQSGDLLSLRTALTRSLGLPELITIAKPSETASVVAFFEEQLRHVTPESLLADCLLFAAKSTNGTPSSLKWFQGWISKLPTGATP
jgi:hypothetical protein